MVTSPSTASAGAFQVTDVPVPLNVPTAADHVYLKSLTFDAASVTCTLTGRSSRTSAKFGGSFVRRPCTVNRPITGGVLVTTGPGSGGGGGGASGFLAPHDIARATRHAMLKYLSVTP